MVRFLWIKKNEAEGGEGGCPEAFLPAPGLLARLILAGSLLHSL
jgi:hypothetical protein